MTARRHQSASALLPPHQHDINLALRALPTGVVGLVILPIIVELDDVGVTPCRKFSHHFSHVLVLQEKNTQRGSI